jgi:beta-barrel assembly-enhancing protease
MNKLIFFLGVTLMFSSCQSKDGDFNLFSTDDDVKMGAQYSSYISSAPGEFQLLSAKDYPEAYSHLNRIVASILQSPHLLHRNEFAWEVNIIENDTILNAFCTPGGYIYVYTGLIKFLDSEDQLAGVLGHEIAHADLRHSTEQLTKNYGVRILINAVVGDASVIGDAAGSLLSLTFSRKDETEADMKSVEYLMDSDYDSRGVARFFEKMEKKGDSAGSLFFLSTHPNPENRVEAIYKKWKELGSKEGQTYKERYKELKKALPQENAE